MTNNEIVTIVYKEYKIDELIKKLIDTSVRDQTYKDLEQYIYLCLLEIENKKLNKLYNKNELKNFIVGIIMNQRNQNRTHYNRKLKYVSNYDGKAFSYIEFNEELIEDELIEYDNTIDDKINFIENEFDNYKLDHSGLTYEDLRIGAEYFYLKEYIRTGLSIRELAKRHLKNRSTIYTLISSGRNRIKEKYNSTNEI